MLVGCFSPSVACCRACVVGTTTCIACIAAFSACKFVITAHTATVSSVIWYSAAPPPPPTHHGRRLSLACMPIWAVLSLPVLLPAVAGCGSGFIVLRDREVQHHQNCEASCQGVGWCLAGSREAHAGPVGSQLGLHEQRGLCGLKPPQLAEGSTVQYSRPLYLCTRCSCPVGSNRNTCLQHSHRRRAVSGFGTAKIMHK